MKFTSSQMILILDNIPTPTASSKQTPTFSLASLLGGNVEKPKAVRIKKLCSCWRFLSWECLHHQKNSHGTSKIDAVEADFFFRKQNVWRFQQSLRGIHWGFLPFLSIPNFLHHSSNSSKLQNPETATRMPNSGDNMDNLSFLGTEPSPPMSRYSWPTNVS